MKEESVASAGFDGHSQVVPRDGVAFPSRHAEGSELTAVGLPSAPGVRWSRKRSPQHNRYRPLIVKTFHVYVVKLNFY